jgi:hypothetical protein
MRRDVFLRASLCLPLLDLVAQMSTIEKGAWNWRQAVKAYLLYSQSTNPFRGLSERQSNAMQTENNTPL